MIDVQSIDWETVLNLTNEYVKPDAITRALLKTISRKVTFPRSKKPDVEIEISPEGVLFTYTGKEEDQKQSRRLSLLSMKVSEACGLRYPSSSESKQRWCPECGAAMRSVKAAEGRVELSCMNRKKCGLVVLQSDVRGKTVYTKWDTGETVRM